MNATILGGKPLVQAQPSRVQTRGRTSKCASRARRLQAKEESKQPSIISEDVLARLRAAEEEAARLRKELAAVQGEVKEAEDIDAAPIRIDGGDLRRETLFVVDSKRRNWLSEADVDFVMGERVANPTGSPISSSALAEEAAEQQVVQRRLLIGGALSIAALALALVPTDTFQPKPSKPLFFYLVPILRAKELLGDCKAIIEDAQWQQLATALSRISGQPNNLRDNLYSAAALLQDGSRRSRAEGYAQELMEYVTNMDFNKYFDSRPNQALTGTQNAQFVEFSSRALAAAQSKIVEFLATMPAEQLDAARTQLSATY